MAGQPKATELTDNGDVYITGREELGVPFSL